MDAGCSRLSGRSWTPFWRPAPLPLMARLAYAPARAWRSGDAPVLRQAAPPQAPIPLGRTLVDTIDGLFKALEAEHGETLVSRTFGLLSASQNGLSRTELLVRAESFSAGLFFLHCLCQ